MKKKNTTDQDIEKAKQSKAEPKAVAQPSREERFNKIWHIFGKMSRSGRGACGALGKLTFALRMVVLLCV